MNEATHSLRIHKFWSITSSMFGRYDSNINKVWFSDLEFKPYDFFNKSNGRLGIRLGMIHIPASTGFEYLNLWVIEAR